MSHQQHIINFFFRRISCLESTLNVRHHSRLISLILQNFRMNSTQFRLCATALPDYMQRKRVCLESVILEETAAYGA